MITVYTTPACPQCITTKRFLDRRDIPYQVVALETDPAARAYVMDTLGYRAAPVVVIQDEDGGLVDSFNGFRPDLLAEHTPATKGAAA